MQLSGLQTEIGQLLADPQNVRWPTSVLNARINLAQNEIQGFTNAVKTSESITPVASQRAYTLNINTLDIVRATRTRTDGNIVPFLGIDLYELEYQFPNWQQWTAGEPLYWYYDTTNRQINLAPTPDGANAIANGLTFWESRLPAALAALTDIPFDSNNQMIPYHMSICHWVVAQCFMDNATAESLQKATFHRSNDQAKPGQYELWVKRIMDRFDTVEAAPGRVLFKPQGGRVGSFNPTKSNPLF